MTKLLALLSAILIGFFLASLWWQRDVGIADNGDFTRSFHLFCSGPVGFRDNYPPINSPEEQNRFLHYWIPRWNLQWKIVRPGTSALLIWAPGVLGATCLRCDELDLRVVSIFPKLLLLAQLIFLLAWIWRQSTYRLVLLLTLAVPMVLVFTATDYVIFLHSFYQESASLVFLLPTLFCLVSFRRRPSRAKLAMFLVCLVLLSTTKASNFYWPLLALPFLLPAWLASRYERSQIRRCLVATISSFLACVVLTVAVLGVTQVGARNINPFDSFFYGSLTFSKHPESYLQKLAIPDAQSCVGQSAWSADGSRFLVAHPRAVTFDSALSVYLHDPSTVWAAAGLVLNNMQDISLEYLGKYARDNPNANVYPILSRSEAGETRLWLSKSERTPWNVWAYLKFYCFPIGGALVLCLIIFAGWFAYGLRRLDGVAKDLATIGAITVLACVLDMAVAILGDGRYELIKHLFFANLLFDVTAACFLSSFLIWVQDQFRPRAKKTSTLETPPASETDFSGREPGLLQQGL